MAVEIARLEPNEIVAPESLFAEPKFARLVAEARVAAAPMGAGGGRAAEQRVCEFYGVETLDGFGAFSRAEIGAAALALAYVKRTQIDATPASHPTSHPRVLPPAMLQAFARLRRGDGGSPGISAMRSPKNCR